MKKRILIFNWKMNPALSKQARELFFFTKKHTKLPLVIAPPFVFLKDLVVLSKKSSRLRIFSQDVSYAQKGAYTGEISSSMLKDIGVLGSIIGHSERRILFKESDNLIKEKLLAANREKLVPVLCIGERRKTSFKKAWPVVRKQLEKDLTKILPKNLIIAYEPVWSIGGNKETDAIHSQKMIKLIKNYFAKTYRKKIPVLYGGSVNCGNIGSFLEYAHIDGFLIGSASLKKEEITCIIKKSINN